MTLKSSPVLILWLLQQDAERRQAETRAKQQQRQREVEAAQQEAQERRQQLADQKLFKLAGGTLLSC